MFGNLPFIKIFDNFFLPNQVDLSLSTLFLPFLH